MDAIIVGSGPNGLAAAIRLAQAGLQVQLREARPTIGGGVSSSELTLPGYQHDLCSAIHPLGMGSPFLRTLPLHEYGLTWVQPTLPVAHPLDDGTAAWIAHSLAETVEGLGQDGPRWARIFEPLATQWQALADAILGPRPKFSHPFLLARFGLLALLPATLVARGAFQSKAAQALFAGLAAHSILPLEQPISASFGLVLGLLAHAVGWPLPRGGAQQIADALAAHLRSLGGEILTSCPVDSLAELPPARAILFDVAPRHFSRIAGDRLPVAYRRRLERYRHGPGVFKLDYALAGPVPWRAAACQQAGTIHLGGTLAEIAAAERAPWQGRHAERPYVLVAQPSVFDPSRAPAGRHTLWAYCHVPPGSTVDMTDAIERQIERFAPGFRELILARAAHNTATLEAMNPNYVGGDINNGVQDWRQLWTRPVAQWNPYATPVKGLYLCSAATPPGGGVHGMCGFHAAETVLQREFAARK